MSDQAEEFITPDRPPYWYTNLQKPPSKIIGRLIDHNQDTHVIFQTAAEAADDSAHETLLKEISQQHKEYQGVLIEHLVQMGEKPKDGRTLLEMLQEMWLKAEGKMGASDEQLLSKSLEEIKQTEGAYDDALQKGLPEDAIVSIERQRRKIKEQRGRLEQIVSTEYA